ncbi:hypothetical protein GGI03_006149, partial [Coemansia sp. RSA 2337]
LNGSLTKGKAKNTLTLLIFSHSHNPSESRKGYLRIGIRFYAASLPSRARDLTRPLTALSNVYLAYLLTIWWCISYVEISAATQKKYLANKLFALGDIFKLYRPTGTAISRDDPILQPYVLSFGQRRVNLHPHVISKLLNYPLDSDRCAVWAHAQLGGIPL